MSNSRARRTLDDAVSDTLAPVSILAGVIVAGYFIIGSVIAVLGFVGLLALSYLNPGSEDLVLGMLRLYTQTDPYATAIGLLLVVGCLSLVYLVALAILLPVLEKADALYRRIKAL